MAAGAPKKRRLSLISAPVTGTAKHIIHDTGTEVGFTATGTPDNYRMATLRLTLQAEWVSGLVQRDKRRAVIQNVCASSGEDNEARGWRCGLRIQSPEWGRKINDAG